MSLKATLDIKSQTFTDPVIGLYYLPMRNGSINAQDWTKQINSIWKKPKDPHETFEHGSLNETLDTKSQSFYIPCDRVKLAFYSMCVSHYKNTYRIGTIIEYPKKQSKRRSV